VPEAEQWAQRDQVGRPVPYSGTQTFRHFACPNEPAYREYMKKVLDVGIHEVKTDEFFFDNVFLQQDAFDEVDAATPADRQKFVFDKVLAVVDMEFEFEDKEVARKTLVEANLKRADELIRDNELYLAIQLLERACALDPRPDELLKLARLLQRNPLWANRALACLRRAIEANPKHVESWLELADFWRRRNHVERQRKSLERALAVDPDNEAANRMYKELAGSRELQRLLRRARQMN
jgi:tetratricopeptide (TPR) repeat protein